MAELRVSAAAVIAAPPGKVHRILADYRRHHPRIVPPEYFKALEVEEGGFGAGTRTRLVMRVLGVTREAHHVVSEPDPGRLLVETDVTGSTVTTFTIDPVAGGQSSRLEIATVFRLRGGILGPLERALTSRVMRRIYRKELALIDAYAARADV